MISAAGRWSARWELRSEKDITIRLHVPFDCEAEVLLPNAPESVYSDSSNPLIATDEDSATAESTVSAGAHPNNTKFNDKANKIFSFSHS